jgi:hypothetical protein
MIKTTKYSDFAKIMYKRINFVVELFCSTMEKGIWLIVLKFERLRLIGV